jgi:hypothetical protein
MVNYSHGSQNQSEVVHVYTMKDYGTVQVQFHLLLTSMRVIGQLQALVDLPAGKETPEIFKKEAKWAIGPVWTFWKTENLFSLP